MVPLPELVLDESTAATAVGAIPCPADAPPVPQTLAETRLRRELVTELVMKAVYFAGECSGHDVAATIRLPHGILQEVFTHLRHENFIEVRGLEGRTRTIFRYQMTDAGRQRTREFLERSRYLGPAPVSLADYRRWVERQSLADSEVEPEALRRGVSHLVLAEDFVEALRPAVHSGRSLFLYGPAGNGKTVIAEAIAHALDDSIFVPHAVEVDGEIIKVFDDSHHRVLPEEGSSNRDLRHGESAHDERWVRTRRPVVMAGGELTLPMLDLQLNPVGLYYEAPLQVKANGGVFVIDDFGRQIIEPHELLNRWIVPLEKREDYLTLHTGKKFPVPFDSLVVFATNLNPWDLVDEAFLRRIRYKIPVPNPTREQYEVLFERMCQTKGIPYVPAIVEFLFAEYYGRRGVSPRFCHPRDIVAHMSDALRHRYSGRRVDEHLAGEACDKYFLDNPFTVSESRNARAAALT